jgi:hypothetical protein
MKEKTEMTMKTDAETVVRRAYHLAEGNVMDVQGFIRSVHHRRRAQRRPGELPR